MTFSIDMHPGIAIALIVVWVFYRFFGQQHEDKEFPDE